MKYFPVPLAAGGRPRALFVCQSVFANRFLPFVIQVDPLANDAEINRGPDGYCYTQGN